MKKIVAIVAGVIASAVAPTTVMADDGVFRARVGVSSNDFETVWSGGTLKTDYTALNLGLSYISESQWYGDIAYKTDTSATWNTRELLSPDLNDEDYGRRDITVTVGKVLDNGVQLFAGYQNSRATMALPEIAQELFGWVAEEEFNVDGFFMGVGRSFSVGSGSLNLNASYGKMDGELVDAQGISNDGDDGKGYSLGASYSYVLGDAVSMTFEVKRQSYSYSYSNPSNPDILIADTGGDDDMTMVGINLNYQF